MNRSTGAMGLLLAALVLLLPVLVAPIPPIEDYPNHLARLWLLSSDAAQHAMAPFYQVHFDTFTNVAIDLIAMTVGKATGWMFAGRLGVALAAILPSLGGALLWWSIHRRAHWWMLSFGLLAWGGSMISAFLNFRISIGLALAAAALEPALLARGVVVQLAVRAAISLVLLVAHPFGLLLYALLLAALAIGPLFEPRRIRAAINRMALPAMSVVGVTLAFVLLVPSLPGAGEHSGLSTLPAELAKGFALVAENPRRKLTNVLIVFRAYNNLVDGVTLLVFLLPLAIAGLRRTLRVHAGLSLLGVLLLVAFALCPNELLGAAWVDARFTMMLPFVVAAGLAPEIGGALRPVCIAALLLAFLGRTAFVGAIWHARQADIAAVAEAVEPVPAGASIMPLEQRAADRKAAPLGRYTSTGENTFRHFVVLAVPWRHAFVPTLFAARGKQPIVTRPPWDAMASPNGGILNDVHVLDPTYPADADSLSAPYTKDWRRFDYILLLNADIPDEYGPFEPPAGVSMVRDAGFARLYRIQH